MKAKFKFPDAGIHLVSQKIGEADFFLEQLKKVPPLNPEFLFLFSAFVSALRSITFCLQYVMRKYPGFDNWYINKQEELRKSDLAKAFVQFRNLTQKTGLVPIAVGGGFYEGIFFNSTKFYVPSNSEMKEAPEGDVIELSYKCLVEVLLVVKDCYKDFDVYIDPRALFTERALNELNWTIEDLEELLGFPKGYTDIPFDDDYLNHNEIRLNLLSKYGGDETMQVYLDKYLHPPTSL